MACSKTCNHAACKECSQGQLFSEARGELVRACKCCIELAKRRGQEELSRKSDVETLQFTMDIAASETMRMKAENSSLKQRITSAADVLEKLHRATEKSVLEEKKKTAEQQLTAQLIKKRAKAKSLKSTVAKMYQEYEAKCTEDAPVCKPLSDLMSHCNALRDKSDAIALLKDEVEAKRQHISTLETQVFQLKSEPTSVPEANNGPPAELLGNSVGNAGK